MERFGGKYRIPSARLPEWDYSTPGYYFITIVTQDRYPYFGKIVSGEMVRSEIGEIVADEWQKTLVIRPNVLLDEWVIMPNHLHGIIIITSGPVETPRWGVSNTDPVETPRRGVSTSRRGVSPGPSKWKPDTLGSIVNQFKSVCTKRIRAAGRPQFAWQPRFYDHIIRDEESLGRIRLYIMNNPQNWEDDHEFIPHR